MIFENLDSVEREVNGKVKIATLKNRQVLCYITREHKPMTNKQKLTVFKILQGNYRKPSRDHIFEIARHVGTGEKEINEIYRFQMKRIHGCE